MSRPPRSSTRAGSDRRRATARRVVTTGCGQGTMFGDLMGSRQVRLPPPTSARIRQCTLPALDDAAQETPYTARRLGARLRSVPRHRDAHCSSRTSGATTPSTPSPAGWGCTASPGRDKVFYTTGRLTSEMVTKAAQLGVPIVVSRNGVTQMGYETRHPARHDAVRARRQPPFPLLLRLRPLRRRARTRATAEWPVGSA